MDKLIQKITGIAVGTVIAVSLSGKACAEELEAVLPEAAPTEIVEQVPTESPDRRHLRKGKTAGRRS